MMKKIAILGASGSIGMNALEVIRNHQNDFELIAFSVYSKTSLISLLLNEFKSVEIVAVRSLDEIRNLIQAFPMVRFVEKEKGLEEIATSNCDIVVNALVGFVGLLPTLKAIENGKDIALANKETLVVAGSLIMKEAKKYHVKILPVDSEHSAIFQCLEKNSKIHKLILTASGGPFFKYKKKDLKSVSVDDALNHPTWKMGNKITIDSATMFNKAFEIIEAYHLFQVEPHQIEVIIHPQSIIHSMVEFEDGSIKAQMGASDMKIPIAYALSYPDRLDNVSSFLDFKDLHLLEFYLADLERFTPLKLAYQALNEKGTFPCVMNAANEEAVYLFLNRKISFNQIFEIVEQTLKAHVNTKEELTLEKILKADQWAREYVRRMIR